MHKLPTTAGGMPMLRLLVLNPWVNELKRRNVDYRELLEAVGLPTTEPMPQELFVSSNLAYRFINLSAKAAGDPYFGATIGFNLNLADLPVISAASEAALTVGDFLARIAINSEQHSNSLKMSLQIESAYTTFSITRLFKPDVIPSHVDAYYVATLINVLKSALPSRWSTKQVRARVCDPDAMPPDVDGLTVLQGNDSTSSLTFPSPWMFEWVDTAARVRPSAFAQDMPAPPATSVDALKVALRPHIHDPDLTVERSAEICGFEKRRLSRHLKEKGTTLAKLIASIWEEEAAKELSGTNRKIGDIARSVGFRDPTVFSRAFKNWTGQSPQEFRRTRN